MLSGMMALVFLLRWAEGAYLPADELTRVVADMNANVAAISARRGSCWMMQLPRALAERQLYLLAGTEPLHETMVAPRPMSIAAASPDSLRRSDTASARLGQRASS